MNARHVGDPYDFFKRWMLECVRASGSDPLAMPLPTGNWSRTRRRQYRVFTGCRRVVTWATYPDKRPQLRQGYFDVISHRTRRDADLFLDPDTGLVANSKPSTKNWREYVSIAEVLRVLGEGRRLVIVYDHSLQHGAVEKGVRRKLSHLKQHDVKGLAYVAQASMLFLCRRGDRLAAVRRRLEGAAILPAGRIVGYRD